jgi:type IV secretory pathway TraG/TraD family ATPase VirD4
MSFNAKDMTQGGQIANMRFRMFGQIANIIFYVLFILFWVLCGLMLMYRLSWQTFVNGCVYWWCTTLAPMRDIIRSQPVYTISYYGKSLNIMRNKSWPINILSGAVSSCGRHLFLPPLYR